MIRTEGFVGAAVAPKLDDLAALRIRVFRDWPYLYDGDLDYERRYLQVYRDTPGAIVVAAFDGERMVGASTGLPILSADPEFPAAFAGSGLDLSRLFYCAESVLLPDYRGHGLGHQFFDLREEQARALGSTHAAFCSVLRAPGHPARPAEYRPLDGFWRKRGYAPLPDVNARFPWRDLGDEHETEKTLQFWMRAL